MKNIHIVIIGAILLSGCSKPDKLCEKVNELENAKNELALLKDKIVSLESEIAQLDTSIEISIGTSVEVQPIKSQPFKHTINVHGVVEASKNILANPEVAGIITSIKVADGEKVKKGQVIATIDASVIQNNIEEVKKGLEFATTIYEKQKSLNDKGVGTEVQFLEAKNRKESLEKTLATLQSQLDKYIVRAPITGYVEDVMPKVGEMASPQMPIAQLVNLEKVFVECEISEALLGKVNEDDEVVVNFKSLNKIVKGKIVQTGQYIHPQNRTFKIKIDLEEQNHLFKPNLLAVVEITDYTSDTAIVVPSTAIQSDMKGDFVYVNEKGLASKKYVNVGVISKSNTEIIVGLKPGDFIIVKGQKGLVEGEKLNIIKI